MRGLTLCLVPGMLALTAVCAHAMPADSGKRIEVRYADLDLGTESGQRTLQRRIKRAAESVCGVREARVGTRLPSLEVRDCYRKAIEYTRPQFAARWKIRAKAPDPMPVAQPVQGAGMCPKG